MTDTIILASGNKHKIEELRSSLAPLGIRLKSSYDYPELGEVEEDAPTLEGNAIKKARYYFEETGVPALSDDTGLEVDALGGRPGVYSARYAGESSTYEDNTEKLLDELNGVDMKDRQAQFRTVVAFIHKESVHTFEGICRGDILRERQGEKGFGYDPVFRPKGYEKTFAELGPEEKNKISHRGRAIRKFVAWLKQQ